LIIEKKSAELIHSVYVTISYAFNTCFLAKKKKKKKSNEKNSREKTKRNKHNKRRFHDSHVCDDAGCSLGYRETNTQI
jgi:hypothetical protein